MYIRYLSAMLFCMSFKRHNRKHHVCQHSMNHIVYVLKVTLLNISYNLDTICLFLIQ